MSFVHIGECEKFIPKYIEFLAKKFDLSEHKFHLKVGITEKELKEIKQVFIYKKTKIGKFQYYFIGMVRMHQAKKIILHSLFDFKIVMILFAMPWLLKKCYWVMWGGDLYSPQFQKNTLKLKIKEFIRKKVIKNIGNLLTYIKEDYEYAQNWYCAKGQYLECFMYPSNLYNDLKLKPKNDKTLNIMVGNSADPMNNHFDVFQKIEALRYENVNIFVPLTYGDKTYADRVIIEGKKLFGEKFKEITNHMPHIEYREFLSEIDIAIFNHKRQQAMGNTISLLGLGKKVYLRNDVPQWKFLKRLGLEVHDIKNFDASEVFKHSNKKNNRIIKDYFSEENYYDQMKEIFFALD